MYKPSVPFPLFLLLPSISLLLLLICSTPFPSSAAVIHQQNVPLDKKIMDQKNGNAFRGKKWKQLLVEGEEPITKDQLAKMFGSPDPYDTSGDKKIAKGKGRKEEDERPALRKKDKPPQYRYDDQFVRSKIFPMAAVAYGSEQNIELCLNKTFPERAELFRNVAVPCNGHDSQLCSGFVALSHSDKAVILAFRGTSTFVQLVLESSQIAFYSQSECQLGGKVASYFTDIFQQLLDGGLMDAAQEIIEKYPGYELWITGHSLGGALASLAAAEIYYRDLISVEKVKLVTFGQPRTGNTDWVAALDNAFPFYTYRVVHNRDVVAHVPPRFFEGYRHHMTEIWYNNVMSTNDTFVQCDGVDEDDLNCSNSVYAMYVSDHVVYYGKRMDLFYLNCE